MKGGSFLPAFQHQKQKILRSRCQLPLATAAAYPLAGTSGILLPLQKGLRKQSIGANWRMTMVPFRRVCVCLSAVIGVQVHLFDLLHQRIPGIGAGALVVEGLLHHFVQTAQEGLFGNTVMPIKHPAAGYRPYRQRSSHPWRSSANRRTRCAAVHKGSRRKGIQKIPSGGHWRILQVHSRKQSSQAIPAQGHYKAPSALVIK